MTDEQIEIGPPDPEVTEGVAQVEDDDALVDQVPFESLDVEVNWETEPTGQTAVRIRAGEAQVTVSTAPAYAVALDSLVRVLPQVLEQAYGHIQQTIANANKEGPGE